MPEILDEDITFRCEAQYRIATGLGLKVHSEAALVPVDGKKCSHFASVTRIPESMCSVELTVFWRLNLDDIST
jgi:hypothetical protein